MAPKRPLGGIAAAAKEVVLAGGAVRREDVRSSNIIKHKIRSSAKYSNQIKNASNVVTKAWSD